MEVYRNMVTGQYLCKVGGNVRIFEREEGLPPFVFTMAEDRVGFIDQSSCVPVGEIGGGWDLEDGKLVDANAAYHNEILEKATEEQAQQPETAQD